MIATVVDQHFRVMEVPLQDLKAAESAFFISWIQEMVIKRKLSTRISFGQSIQIHDLETGAVTFGDLNNSKERTSGGKPRVPHLPK